MTVVDVAAREASELSDSPYGQVGDVFHGRDLRAWWVWKDDEEIDPQWKVFAREDLVVVLRGELRIDFRNAPEESVVVRAGQCFVIPPGRAFRGYRVPRDGREPCLFVAVSTADQAETLEPGSAEARP